MSVMEPEPEHDWDDEFAKLTASIDMGDMPDPSDTVNVALLDDAELNKRFTLCREELMNRSEMLKPSTDRGRELHSERAAYLIELKKRGMR